MDPAEFVSQEARRIEIESTQELLREGIFQKLHAIWRRGSFVQVIYDPLHKHWLITLRYIKSGEKFSASVTITDEDLDARTASLETWKQSLRVYAMSLMAQLRADLRAAGIEMPLLEENGSSYEAGKGLRPLLNRRVENIYEMGVSTPAKVLTEMGWTDEWNQCTCGGKSFGHLQSCPKYREEMEAKEEAEAIESVKRTLAEQAGSAEEP